MELTHHSDNEISIYRGELTTQCVIRNVAMIKKAFPGLAPGFYDVFADMVREDGFCDDRLTDAVKHVIRTCQYPSPTIANFLSYDKTIKVKTYDQMCNEELWDQWLPVKFPDRPKVVWVHANDVAMYGLEKYLTNNQTKRV